MIGQDALSVIDRFLMDAHAAGLMQAQTSERLRLFALLRVMQPGENFEFGPRSGELIGTKPYLRQEVLRAASAAGRVIRWDENDRRLTVLALEHVDSIRSS